ncbi:MAG TPA: HupE/UreJ family protein [Candidatus Omnitrophota bacterium]|nr:HupE/UreJ family protein [Candidatus Omnitrophota bacterium]
MRRAAVAALAAGAAVPVAAHLLGGDGFSAGLHHPLGGLDHLLAMVGVGLWAGQRGGRSTWALPVAFVAAMVAGGGLGLAGIGLPAVEIAILGSVIVLGTLVALRLRPPVWAGMALAGLFALFHGHAHGAEMPSAVHPVVYAAGFVTAAAILHLAGIAAALILRDGRLVRAGGAAIALSGMLLMVA